MQPGKSVSINFSGVTGIPLLWKPISKECKGGALDVQKLQCTSADVQLLSRGTGSLNLATRGFAEDLGFRGVAASVPTPRIRLPGPEQRILKMHPVYL